MRAQVVAQWVVGPGNSMPPREKTSPLRCAGTGPAWGQGQLVVGTCQAFHLLQPGTEGQARGVGCGGASV